jgi:hypothetical protein
VHHLDVVSIGIEHEGRVVAGMVETDAGRAVVLASGGDGGDGGDVKAVDDCAVFALEGM